MKFDKNALLLYAVTDRSWLNGRSLYEDVEASLKGGVTMVQLREKDMPFEMFLEEAKAIKELCKKYAVPFVINDNIEVAIACDADGVHIGQDDMNASAVREKLGDEKIIGVSAQTVLQAKKAEEDGADYLGVGAMFTTATKADADDVSNAVLKAICETVSIPVCAIGGITKENMHMLSGTGIEGVALVSAIYAAENIQTECEELTTLVKKTIERA